MPQIVAVPAEIPVSLSPAPVAVTAPPELRGVDKDAPELRGGDKDAVDGNGKMDSGEIDSGEKTKTKTKARVGKTKKEKEKEKDSKCVIM